MNLQAISDGAKNYFSKENVNFSWLLGLLLYAGLGFFTGLIVKFFGRIIIWLVLIALIAFLLFNYLGMLTVNFENVRHLMGTHDLTLTQIFEISWNWIQNHILQSIAWLIGFVLAFEFA